MPLYLTEGSPKPAIEHDKDNSGLLYATLEPVNNLKFCHLREREIYGETKLPADVKAHVR